MSCSYPMIVLGERELVAGDLATAVAQGRVLVFDDGDAVIAAAVVGASPAPCLRLLIVDPGVIAPGLAERMRQAAVILCDTLARG